MCNLHSVFHCSFALAMLAASQAHAATPLEAGAACRAADAHYALVDNPAYAIVLKPARQPAAASNLQLRLLTPQSRHDFDFTLSNGYGTTFLIEMTDSHEPDADANAEPAPDPDAEDDDTAPPAYYAFAEDMTARNEPPQADTHAPAWIFLPDMGMRLWYGLLRDRNSRRGNGGMPAGLFRRIACGP